MRSRAYKTLDCAKRVRIHYQLPRPLDVSFAALFPDAEVVVQPFSRFVKGAKDHLTITRGDRFRAAGVIGEPRLVVTYGKTAWQWSPDEIAAFEAILEGGGYGEVVYPEHGG
jgi:hypothetical protein